MTVAAPEIADTPAIGQYSREQEIGALEALDRIEASGLLGAGERLPAMLRYIVREELSGRGDRIKGFTIATEVLGRGADFDPQADGIARAEMTRLRKALDHYNARSSIIDAVRIEIPRGSFRPRLSFPVAIGHEDVQAPVPSFMPRGWRRVGAVMLLAAVCAIAAAYGLRQVEAPAASGPPLLVVQPVRPAPASAFAEGLAGAIAAELAHQPWLTVIHQPLDGALGGALGKAARSRPVYLLETEIEKAGVGVSVRSVLKRWVDQSVRWSHLYEDVSAVAMSAETVRGVARSIARDLSQPGGAIALAEVARQDAAPEAERRFACMMVVRRYWNSYDAALRTDSRTCLEDAVRRGAEDWSSRAALALFVIEDARVNSGEKRAALLAEARMLAPDVDRSNLLLQGARLALAACEENAAALRAVAGNLLAMFPNNADVLGDVGSKLGLAAGDWPKAIAVETRAMELNPAAPPWYPLATVARSLMDGRPAVGAALLERAPQRGLAIGHVLRLAVGGAIGDPLLVRDARLRLHEQGLPDPASILALIEGECWSRDVKDTVKSGVEAAARL
jgi:adenylate cyclase